MGAFTYEDIYELLRTEKYSTDLQTINKDDLGKIKEYFDAKKALLDKQVEGSAFYDPEKKDKLRTELENAKRALKDLYEKREQKIINRALFCSRTDFKLKDSTNMLPSEVKSYDLLIDLLRTGNREFYDSIEHSKTHMVPPIENTKGLKEAQKTKLLKFREAVPEITDSDLHKYGPFEPQATAELPSEIADLLINQNKAVEHEDTKKNQ